MGALGDVLGKAYAASADGPVAVIAHTVKGKGVSFMENRCEWHGKAPSDAQLKTALGKSWKGVRQNEISAG